MRSISLLLLFLAGPALAQGPQSSAPTPPAAEKRICRASVETGSLVKKRKTCHTKAEWDQMGEAARQEAREAALNNAGRPEGGQ